MSNDFLCKLLVDVGNHYANQNTLTSKSREVKIVTRMLKQTLSGSKVVKPVCLNTSEVIKERMIRISNDTGNQHTITVDQ